MSDELYKKFRPRRFSDLAGQDDAVLSLKSMLEKGEVPHTILITGPSGCGKTTIARILRQELQCGEYDYKEIDCASDNGIDMVRSLKAAIGCAPISGPCRIFLMDECHQLSNQAQDSLLKMLEDTPKHVYFILNTTDARKLKETIRTRCTEVKVKSLTPRAMQEAIARVSKKAKIKISESVVDKIIEAARGSARRAMVLLHQVKDIATEQEQIATILSEDVELAGIDLARKLMDTRSTWADIAAILKALELDPEGVRRCVLGYAAAILLNQGKGKQPSTIEKRATLVLEAFESNLFDSGKPGLVLAAYNCYSMRG